MRLKCRVLSLVAPASDGSRVSREVMQEYLDSKECSEALAKHTMVGALTHRARSIAANFAQTGVQLSKVVGKDDSLLIVSDQAPAPTHYVSKLFIEGDWLCAELEVLDESYLDDIAVQNIRRLKGMLKNGIYLCLSAVIVGLWSEESNGSSDLKKVVSIKGVDFTQNNSWKGAQVQEIIDDEGEEKKFSEITYSTSPEFEGIRVKAFSIDASGYKGPKSSKINGQFTRLMAKEFSSCSPISESIDIVPASIKEEIPVQKEFSAAQVNERVRFAKLSPRERFRRLILDYRQALKAQGGIEKIDPEVLSVMKSLFESDLLAIMKVLQPQIMAGKNLVALLNASSLGMAPRKAAQALMIPFKMSLNEEKKMGFVSKQRYQKISQAYVEFVRAMEDYVFGVAPLEINEDEAE